MRGSGEIESYEPVEKGEIAVYPELSNVFNKKTTKNLYAYLIAIDPAPGLEKAFEDIGDSALQGLLAHELAEINIIMKNPGYHKKIEHHGLQEKQVDRIAAQKGYGLQVISYLEFIKQNTSLINERPRQEDIFDCLIENGVAGIDLTKHEKSEVVNAVNLEVESRLRALRS
jgi:hypothetical protein